ncbi:PAS domain S-box protein [Mucilaginibacter robiniae]|uniref:PAS domain S-box protein n=1 Tax=Mucilaginibacter robiniae TaxID=2728022 RepID=A0A7L5DZQ2_9SPHI|nr:PAS domain S-box protein [Mucilaginibacter robiniae]QJD94754.1 PAS domain S-box protein [Mucilaginibacter robiniae]
MKHAPSISNHDTDEKIYRLLAATSKSAALICIDANGYILSRNQGIECIYGYAADEVIGKHFSIFYKADEAGKKTFSQ